MRDPQEERPATQNILHRYPVIWWSSPADVRVHRLQVSVQLLFTVQVLISQCALMTDMWEFDTVGWVI